MTFQPLNGRVEVKPMEEGGIVISQNEKYDTKGTVTSVYSEDHARVSVGDIVFFNSWDADKCHIDGDDYRYVVHETDLLGRIPHEPLSE